MQNETVSQAIQRGYFKMLEMDCLKKKYDCVGKEINRLAKIDPITKAGARKRLAIEPLKREQIRLSENFQFLVPEVSRWLETVFKDEKPKKLKILKKYYTMIEENNLQEIIDELYPPSVLERDEDEGEIVPFLIASNLRQEIHTAWKQQIQNAL